MKLTTALLTALSVAASAAAQQSSAGLPACEPPTKAGILLPARNATLSTTKPTRFYFCSPTYFRASTASIDVVLSSNSSFTSGALLATGLKPGNVAGQSNSYLYNITVPPYGGPRGKAYLGVFERINGYYNPGYQVFQTLVNVV